MFMAVCGLARLQASRRSQLVGSHSLAPLLAALGCGFPMLAGLLAADPAAAEQKGVRIDALTRVSAPSSSAILAAVVEAAARLAPDGGSKALELVAAVAYDQARWHLLGGKDFDRWGAAAALVKLALAGEAKGFKVRFKGGGRLPRLPHSTGGAGARVLEPGWKEAGAGGWAAPAPHLTPACAPQEFEEVLLEPLHRASLAAALDAALCCGTLAAAAGRTAEAGGALVFQVAAVQICAAVAWPGPR